MNLLRAALLLALLTVTACADPTVVFDRSRPQPVQRMAVLTPGFPAEPDVSVPAPTSGALFLLVNSIQQGNRSREFAGMVTKAGANPEAEFSAALLACLRDAKFQTAATQTDARRTALLKEYAALAGTGADAVLDIVVNRYGYRAPTQAAPFQPSLTIQARLVALPSRTILMQERIDMANVALDGAKPDEYGFQDYSDIAAGPAKAVQGLQGAMRAAAATICKRLT